MLRFYRQPAVPASRLKQLQEAANVRLAASATPSVISKIDSEVAYYVELSVPKLSDTGKHSTLNYGVNTCGGLPVSLLTRL